MGESTLAVHDLSFVAEGADVVVGRLDTGSYAVFPADGAELLRRLAEGMPLEGAEAWYESTFSESVDLDDFIDTLRELGFVREDTDAAANPGFAEERGARSAGTVRFQRLGRAVFSPLAWCCYAAVVAFWLVTLAHHSDLEPHPSQIFFTKSLLLVQVVITFGQVPLLLLHEGFHILAGRRLGLPSRLRLSNRLTYIVAETQINGLMSVPPRKRYLPFLAGMACDVLVLSALDLAADLGRDPGGRLSLSSRLCLALAFTVLMRILWQFQLYLRTDLFFVLATAFNCYDLHDASKAILKNRFWRLLRLNHRTVEENQWTERDRQVGVFYGPFLVLGFCVLAAITVFVSFPVALHYFGVAADSLGSGHINGRFWDAASSLCFNVAQVVALIVLSRRKRRQTSAQASVSGGGE